MSTYTSFDNTSQDPSLSSASPGPPTVTLTEVVRINATSHDLSHWTMISDTWTEHATLLANGDASRTTKYAIQMTAITDLMVLDCALSNCLRRGDAVQTANPDPESYLDSDVCGGSPRRPEPGWIPKPHATLSTFSTMVTPYV
ncbi:uncharacterized protein DSM5745_04344 [Aspergillus mulundensis]|uniref:Uncharacterized protein n=1 Tax=Aspergillus mulundensis TaxID=1810919 RepID=A0A3D8SE35_9EURO|nr:hypothetical protein DSM5745_04344 [Aspergillus mulundensis]RDW84018.1 hypothetical protein DSM5745_04344 [Aspergillus mulundensis]